MDITQCGEGINKEFDEREAEAAFLGSPQRIRALVMTQLDKAYAAGWRDCEAAIKAALQGQIPSVTVADLEPQQATQCCNRSSRDCDCDPHTQGKSW